MTMDLVPPMEISGLHLWIEPTPSSLGGLRPEPSDDLPGWLHQSRLVGKLQLLTDTQTGTVLVVRPHLETELKEIVTRISRYEQLSDTKADKV